MRIRQLVLWLIFICIIAFWWISCAPSTENATSIYADDTNFILWGFWNGITLIFSVPAKLLGMDIGLFDIGKKSSVSYWVGYLLALYIYGRVIQFFWFAFKEHREITRSK
jgi:hypothetical protein